MFLRVVFTSLNPFKHLVYYCHYFQMVDLIVVYRDRKAISLISTLICLHLYSVSQLIYLKLFNPSYRDRIVQANSFILFYSSAHDHSIDLPLGAIKLMGAYFYYAFYLNPNIESLRELASLLAFGDRCQAMFIDRWYSVNVPVNVYLKKFSQKILYLFQVFTIMIETISIYYTAYFIKLFYDNLDHFSSNVLKIALFCANVLAHNIIWNAFSHVGILIASLGMIGLRSLHLRLRQNDTILRLAVYRFHWSRVGLFIRNDLQTFIMMLKSGVMFNHLFLVFCVVNFPINAYIVMLLILGKFARFSALIFGCLAYQQIFGNLLIHLCMAQFTKQAHKSAKVLLSLMVHKQHKVGRFRDRLCLVNCILRLHTTNQYGFTYGRCGLVTFNKFAKCLLLYGKLLMFSYKLITRI